MHLRLKRFLVVALLFAPAIAVAGSVTLTWTAPTQNTDGTPLTDLAGYKLYWGTTPGVYPNSVTVNDPLLTSYEVTGLAPATYEFVATAFNTAGVESDYSNTATKTIAAPVPSPPQNLTVDPGNLTAYGISQSEDVVVLFPVGSVPANTSCDSSMSVNGKYRVPRSSVTFPGSVQPPVVFAECIGSGS